MPIAVPHAHAETPTAHSDFPHSCFGQMSSRDLAFEGSGSTGSTGVGSSWAVLDSISNSVFGADILKVGRVPASESKHDIKAATIYKKMPKTPAWSRKAGQNKHGGLNAKGRASYNKNGHHIKAPVKSGNNPRRASFLARMGHMPGPEYRNGKPTRLLLSLRAWGASSKSDAIKKANAISKHNHK